MKCNFWKDSPLKQQILFSYMTNLLSNWNIISLLSNHNTFLTPSPNFILKKLRGKGDNDNKNGQIKQK